MGRKLEQIRLEEIGKIYGFLKIIDYIPADPNINKLVGRVIVECLRCNSGITKIVDLASLKRKATLSCGCYSVFKATTHGLSNHPYYDLCIGAISRCSPIKPIRNDYYYNNYYLRGIRSAWCKTEVANFISYLEENLPPKQDGLSLDRIDNDDDYRPGNLRWATQAEQNANKRPRISNWQYDEKKAEKLQLQNNIDDLSKQMISKYIDSLMVKYERNQ